MKIRLRVGVRFIGTCSGNLKKVDLSPLLM